MDLKLIAEENLTLVERGSYTGPSGSAVPLRDLVDASVRGTVLYRPNDFDSLPLSSPSTSPRRIEVTAETTANAARRLYESGARHIALLNFASARNPGGGFIRGAKAQEEDLARCSALYQCLMTQPEYYSFHRAQRSMLYSDHMIYSPDVPFFRDDEYHLLDHPYLASVITTPAPNFGEAERASHDEGHLASTVRSTRCRTLLTLASTHQHRVLILGAWGCGVFRNDPTEVAETFSHWLDSPLFEKAFDHVVFAIYDRSKTQDTMRAFQRRFGS